jgi:hypothetical protein
MTKNGSSGISVLFDKKVDMRFPKDDLRKSLRKEDGNVRVIAFEIWNFSNSKS